MKTEELLERIGPVRAGANRELRLALEHVSTRLEQLADYFDTQ